MVVARRNLYQVPNRLPINRIFWDEFNQEVEDKIYNVDDLNNSVEIFVNNLVSLAEVEII